MKFFRNGYRVKVIASLLAFTILSEVIFPTAALALTSGPKSPEFSTFQPTVITDMVNVFGGDFSYNLPVLDIHGPDGAGYSLSLGYNSGLSPEEEASWVGYGWTLNPGAIDRVVRGFPDDYAPGTNNMSYFNRTEPNWTATGSATAGLQFFAQQQKSGSGEGEGGGGSSGSSGESGGGSEEEKGNSSPSISFSVNSVLRYNNYQGMQRSFGLDVEAAGVSAGANYSASGITYSAAIDIKKTLSRDKQKKESINSPEAKEAQGEKKQTQKVTKLQQLGNKALNAGMNIASIAGSNYGAYIYSDLSQSTYFPQYSGLAIEYGLSLAINPGEVPIGGFLGTAGTFNAQRNENYHDRQVAGYMNSDQGSMDYYMEKGNSFSKRDLFLGIPFGNADLFNVSGEGIGGGFRYVPSQTGMFSPENVTSKSTAANLALRLGVGADLGVGIDIGGGFTSSKIEGWSPSNAGDLNFSPGKFRFNNDMGGEAEASTVELGKVSLDRIITIPGFKYTKLKSANSDVAYSSARTPRRSSYIEEKKSGSMITGFRLVNEEGIEYCYNNPVNVSSEASVQVNIPDGSIIENNHLARLPGDRNITVNSVAGLLSNDNVRDYGYNMVVGERKNTAYASAFLLSEIHTYDFVDANKNGVADNSDLGGWTKFQYHPKTSDYKFRSPYNSNKVLYMPNSLSTTKDDAGSVNLGTRDVQYLKVIETKTHIAYFVTNVSDAARFGLTTSSPSWKYMQPSGQQRKDAYDASDESQSGTNKSEQLEKIVLFSKTRLDKPLRVVRFEYSNELCPGLPNAKGNTGKLTLKKVWFEYEGVSNARISPYIFEYNYPKKADFLDLPSGGKYAPFHALLEKYAYGSENPSYQPWLLDAWGNLQNNPGLQHGLRRPWLSQRPDAAATDKGNKFDPAAWHLKQIKLPSGGIIMVEYEQKDYLYVQDRDVMAMASIHSSDFSDYGDMVIRVNPEDLGFDSQTMSATALEDKINEYFGADGSKQKIYYKLLFSRDGAPNTNPGFYDENVEYITGYGELVPLENGKIVVYDSNWKKLRFKIKGEKIKGSTIAPKTTSPRQAAYDFFATQRVGYNSYGRYDDQVKSILDNNSNLQSLKTVLKVGTSIAPDICLNMAGDVFNFGSYGIPNKRDICMTFSQGESNDSRSYLKLPMATAKKGGGVRVKRLYMYDKGLESGAAELYGNEYIYENADGRSSGVATNEPAAMREENPLVTFLPSKKQQSLFSRLTAGIEVENTEGPLGESLLPSASVGYSRVVVRNIHDGPTGTGFTITEYYTAKDYPFDKYYGGRSEIRGGTGIDKTNLGDEMVTDKFSFPIPMLSISKQNSWASQGFRFILNNMHGQMKKLSSYGGSYEDYKKGDMGKVYLASGKEFYYYEPGEPVTLLEETVTNGNVVRNWVTKVPGKEVEVAMEGKSVSETSMNFKLGIQIDIGLSFFPPIYPSAYPTFSLSFNKINTFSNSKVIRYPVILKKVLEYKDGINQISENLMFNLHNGKPVLTRSYDSFHNTQDINANGVASTYDGSVYTFSTPASWKYPGMGAIDNGGHNLLSATCAGYTTYQVNPVVLNQDNPLIPSGTWSFTPQNVLDASVNTFAQGKNVTSVTWLDQNMQTEYGVNDAQGSITAFNEKWRPFETYEFKDMVGSRGMVNNVFTDIRSAGMMKNFYDYFGGTPNNAGKWIRTSTVTKYSPHGNAMEELNVLSVPSTVKYGYSNFVLPVMKASNASYNSIFFNDYENSTGASVSSAVAHSGSRSLSVSSSSAIQIFPSIKADDILRSKGGIFRVWIKSSAESASSPSITLNSGRKIMMEKVGQSNGWTLFMAHTGALSGFAQGSNISLQLIYPLQPGETAWLDDARFEPVDAEALCYVYDPNSFRLVAQFDSQHFGVYYQYNAEGRLVRKLVETEKGMVTLQETQYNTRSIIPQ